MQTVCVRCQAQYLPKRLGLIVIETTGDQPKPLRAWSADMYGCPICGAEILSHFGHEPIMENHEEGFEAFIAEIRKGERFVMYNPAYQAQRVWYETAHVRKYVKQHIRPADR